MAGYTPVFDTVFEGSLCGRYPETAAWMFFLALADWKGEVDKTPEFIATITGMPLGDLRACIARFMEPDSRSRSQAEEGRKLVLIDAHRDWGWRVVNIAFYRRKASGQDQISDGRNAEKVRRYKERHRETPEDTAGHPGSPPDTNSYSDTNIHKTAPRKRGCRVPEPFPITEDMRAWALAKCPHVTNVDGATEEFVDYWRGVAGRAATKLDWEGTWRNRMRELEERSGRKNGTAKASNEWR